MPAEWVTVVGRVSLRYCGRGAAHGQVGDQKGREEGCQQKEEEVPVDARPTEHGDDERAW